MAIRSTAILAVVLVTTATAFTSSSFLGSGRRPLIQNCPTCYHSSSNNLLTMKIFDWKRRNSDESAINDMDNFVLNPSNLRPAPGSRKRKKRKGRGIAAGQGASCGFGMRGQKSRSGSGTRPGFEGGQNPLYRRLPKFVGKPVGPGHTKTIYNLIKLDELNGVQAGGVANFDTLFESGVITKSKYNVHKVVVGREDFTAKDITVQAHAFTASAREAIEAAGGKCQLVKRTTGELIEA